MEIELITVNFKPEKKFLFKYMDEKISLDAIGAYGDAYADKVSKTFFSSRNRINGSEILSLCRIPQVNLFVVRELLLVWREEMKKLKSPYFDYDDADVKESLDNFMAVLSKHISVTEEYFVPLLKKAVRQTLLLIFNPYDFFSILLAGNNNRIELDQFREDIKYLRINKAPLVGLLEKLEQKGVRSLSGNEAFAVLDEILEEVSFTPEDLDEHIRLFSETLPLNPGTFFQSSTPPPSRATEPEKKTSGNERRLYADDDHKDRNTEKASFNDSVEQRPAVYNNFQKISKIKDSLTINQKFMFTKVLFYGDFESFSRAIDEIDKLSDMQAALSYLEAQSSGWDRDSREFHEFMEMVEKRFS